MTSDFMKGRSRIPRVVVVGSLNVDYIAQVDRLPAAGETVAAHGLVRRFGGKGANQAVAAARQGARVSLVGCVGADADGAAYVRHFRREGIATHTLTVTPRAPTGTALIAVDTSAENLIVVVPGANGCLSPAQVRRQRRSIAAAVLLVQWEIPPATVQEAICLANQFGVPVVMNPSPWRDGFPWGRLAIDTLIVNRGEAEKVFERAVDSLPRELAYWRQALRAHRVERLLITRGAESTLHLDAETFEEIPTVHVIPVDTVGAGDAFAGTYAARRAAGETVRAAVRAANAAGALATLKAGAQEALPTRAVTDRALRRASMAK